MADFNSVIIDHLNIGVADVEVSAAFYDQALAPLGIKRFFDFPAGQTDSKQRIVGYGKENDRPVLWLIDQQTVGTHTHLALQAANREQVDAFYKAALEAGASDHGKPGVRFYHPHYYGGFVIDPNGINLEVVCHAAP